MEELLSSHFLEMDAKINYISSSETECDLEMTINDPNKHRETFTLKFSIRPKSSDEREKESQMYFDPKLGFQTKKVEQSELEFPEEVDSQGLL